MVKRFLMGISIIENDSAHFVGQAFTNYPYYINNLLFAGYFNIPEQCNIVLLNNKPYTITIKMFILTYLWTWGVANIIWICIGKPCVFKCTSF